MKIGVIQLRSVLDPAQNLSTIREFLAEAKNEGAEAVFLPEVFYSMSDGTRPTPFLVEGKNDFPYSPSFDPVPKSPAHHIIYPKSKFPDEKRNFFSR
jgi:hypothetical protein